MFMILRSVNLCLKSFNFLSNRAFRSFLGFKYRREDIIEINQSYFNIFIVFIKNESSVYG
jgi:hypothetical protein